jgi:hypothetical protein
LSNKLSVLVISIYTDLPGLLAQLGSSLQRRFDCDQKLLFVRLLLGAKNSFKPESFQNRFKTKKPA